MDERPEVYIIPTNIADNGNVLKGYFKKKNAYEAAAILSIGLVVSVLLLGFLPVMPRVVVFCLFFIFSMLALAGVKGESFVEFLLEKIFFKRKMRVMKYRLPRKEEPKESRWKKKNTEEE